MSQLEQREEEVFEAALRLAADQRAIYLDQTCAGDADLRRRVEVLLGAFERAGGFMKQPAVPTPARTVAFTRPPFEKAGDKIGRYKLLEQIGEGGCGVVYVAEQEEPVRRRVALKVIKLGMDTRQVIARFDAERQALALMDHPNIAKIFDAGATDSPHPAAGQSEISNLKSKIYGGRPYFVMELVRGIKITDYCDQNRLSPRERLDLFTQVCRAVQHAHQKGIIHRDIKPSNILVTLHDGVPVPKVIDFGIAKATQGRLTDQTVYTAFEQFIGTPAYMSPEQAEMSGLDIDTRSDIYSLGVLLYELLTGTTPFDAKALLAAGLDAMRRTIREVEPVKPSTRLTQELSALARERAKVGKWESEKVGEVASPSACSHSPTFPPAHSQPRLRRDPHELQRLIPALRGDLDWIVMKCLEKDRTRRYETANGLAMDILRHLNEEPVVACPPSRLYRWQKFARKHRTSVGVAGGFVLLLTVATIMSTSLAFWANRERRLARASDAEARAVLRFFQENLLAAARPEGQDGGLGYDITLRSAVDAAEPGIARAFTNQPLVEASIRDTLGGTYAYLGDHPAAYRQHQRAWELFRAGLGPDHPSTLDAAHGVAANLHEMGDVAKAVPLFEDILQRRLATQGTNALESLHAMCALGSACRASGQLSRALALLEEALPILQTNFGPEHVETIVAMNLLTIAYRDADRPAEVVRLLEEVLRAQRRNPETAPGSLVTSMNNLARAYEENGRLEDAALLAEDGLKLAEAKLGPDNPGTLILLNTRGWLNFKIGRPEAVSQLEQALQATQARLGPEHPDTAGSMNYLAIARFGSGQSDEAVRLFEEVLRIRRLARGADHLETLSSMNDLGIIYRRLGYLDKALPLHEGAWKKQTERLGPDHQSTLISLNSVILVYAAMNRLDEALPLFDEALRLRLAKGTATDSDTHATIQGVAVACIQAGRSADAESRLRAVTEAQRKAGPDGEIQLAENLILLGEARLRQDKHADAEEPLSECLGIRERKLPDDWRTFNTRSMLGGSLLGQEKYDAAEPLLHSGYEGMKQREEKNPAVGRRRLKETLQRLVQLYEATNQPDKAAEWKLRLAEFDKATK